MVPPLFAHTARRTRTFTRTRAHLSPLRFKRTAVEDLLSLVVRAAREPKLEQALRETLNMSRDAAKWRNLTRILHEKVGAG